MFTDIHHVQLAMPAGQEGEARAFFGEQLGMTELAKPEALAARGGCWFAAGRVELHLGVETPFHPARKAHPAFGVPDLDAMVAHLEEQGIPYRRDVDLPRFRRVFIDDPFGNRIEILQSRAPD